ncbi:MAG: exodeoxyribonuclease V subunit alpha [Lysobacteraceae bacterium]
MTDSVSSSSRTSAAAAQSPLQDAISRWVRGHGGSALLAGFAARAVAAEAQGDSAVSLSLSAQQREALRGETLLCDVRVDDRTDTPFVLDHADRFYLRRNYRHEQRIAEAWQARLRTASAPASDACAADLDALFGVDSASPARPDHAQRVAAGRVLGEPAFVLTGGPGTGKTRTVLRMLLMCLRQAGGPLRIRLAAPTGKAAQRLRQSLQDGLPPLRDLDAGWQDSMAALRDLQAETVHRLLAWSPHERRFRHDARRPLPVDLVVVDEASMLDLAQWHALLDAVPPQARLILLGDADQLTSVGAGSVFSDLVEVLERQRDPRCIRLQYSFRAEGALSALNGAVQTGDWMTALQALHADPAHIDWQSTQRARDVLPAIRRSAERLAADSALQAAAGAASDPTQVARAALLALGRQQWLCALREGQWGSVTFNAHIEAILRQAWRVDGTGDWFGGRAVIVQQNDYELGLFNGDLGICVREADGRLGVWFAGTDAEAPRRFAPLDLPHCESAFAISIHKSQGSEYPQVHVVLPPDPEHRILSRQLLYTALSRARQSVHLYAGEAALRAALERRITREGGLRERLQVVEP